MCRTPDPPVQDLPSLNACVQLAAGSPALGSLLAIPAAYRRERYYYCVILAPGQRHLARISIMSKRIRVADDCFPAGSSLSSSSASGGGRPITISSSPYFSKAAERIPTHRRKRRCWQFHVTGITRDGSGGGFDVPGENFESQAMYLPYT